MDEVAAFQAAGRVATQRMLSPVCWRRKKDVQFADVQVEQKPACFFFKDEGGMCKRIKRKVQFSILDFPMSSWDHCHTNRSERCADRSAETT